jgi:hypothetical protein
MNKLGLKHLQHYPMGINGIKLFREKSGRIDTLYGIQTTNSGNLLICINECDWRENNYWNYKPILHPLSDLVKPCLPEDKTPAEEMEDDLIMGWCVAYDEAYEIITENEETLKAKVKMLPHEMVEWLFEHHFDVNNLIEQGLAVDINTIEK